MCCSARLEYARPYHTLPSSPLALLASSPLPTSEIHLMMSPPLPITAPMAPAGITSRSMAGSLLPPPPSPCCSSPAVAGASAMLSRQKEATSAATSLPLAENDEGPPSTPALSAEEGKGDSAEAASADEGKCESSVASDEESFCIMILTASSTPRIGPESKRVRSDE